MADDFRRPITVPIPDFAGVNGGQPIFRTFEWACQNCAGWTRGSEKGGFCHRYPRTEDKAQNDFCMDFQPSPRAVHAADKPSILTA